jgi:peroxiredoxin Q/BCP
MRSSRYFIAGVALLALLALSAGPMSTAGEKGKGKKAATMKPGDKAPTFDSIDDQGKTFKSTDVVGKKVVVLFFYPAALTGG